MPLGARRAAPVRAAAASPEVYRELPIGALLNGAVVSGAVDLLYRDVDDWVVVDYKTDRGADAGVLRERYEPQAPPTPSPARRPPGDPFARWSSSLLEPRASSSPSRWMMPSVRPLPAKSRWRSAKAAPFALTS